MTEKRLLPLAIFVLALGLCFNFYVQDQSSRALTTYYDQLLPHGNTTEAIADNAVRVFDGENVLVAYAGLAQYNGFGGPMLVGVVTDVEGVITKLEILDHKETPSYLVSIAEAGFFDQYQERSIIDGMTFGVDIDGIASATLSSRAVAVSAEKIAESIRVNGLGLPSGNQSMPWQFGLAEVAVAMMIAGALVLARVSKLRKYRLAFLAISVVGIGFWLNRPVTMAQISGLFMGYFPAVKANLIWYMLVLVAVLPPIVFGKNYYCTYLCPFGAVQEGIGMVTKKCHLPLNNKMVFLAKTRNLLVFVALLVAFLFQNPSISSFEPFAALFNLQASGIQLLLVVSVLGAAIFFRKLWCVGFCPVGGFLDLLVRYRNRYFGKKHRQPLPTREKTNLGRESASGDERVLTAKEKRADGVFKFFYFMMIFSVIVAIFEKWSIS